MSTSCYKDSPAVHLALHLLIKANYQDAGITFDGQEIIIRRGEHLTGRKKLSEETGIKQSTLRNKLKLLEKTRFLDIKSNNKFSIITICKYEDFQNIKTKRGQQRGQPADNQRTTSGQPADTPNKDKEVKEVKEIKERSAFPHKYFFQALKTNPAYQGVDIELAKRDKQAQRAAEVAARKQKILEGEL